MADSLLQEVDEALRADRMAALWKKNKGAIMGVIAALILGTAASSAWQHYRQVQGGHTFEQMNENYKLLDSGKFDQAATGFGKVAENNRGELRSLAQVWQARAELAAGKKEKAIAILKEAANGKSLWADVACLRLAGLDASQAGCLSVVSDSPLAAERTQWAAAESWSKGERAAAIAQLEKLIANPNTGDETRARLSQWLAIIKAQKEK